MYRFTPFELPDRVQRAVKSIPVGELTDEDSIWPCVKTFNLYDPATLIAAIPALRGYFYRSTVLEVRGVEHHLIGVSASNHGVINPEELARYLADGLVQSLEMSMADLQSHTA